MDVDQGAAAFPVELAAHARRPLVNAALEFINATCHMMPAAVGAVGDEAEAPLSPLKVPRARARRARRGRGRAPPPRAARADRRARVRRRRGLRRPVRDFVHPDVIWGAAARARSTSAATRSSGRAPPAARVAPLGVRPCAQPPPRGDRAAARRLVRVARRAPLRTCAACGAIVSRRASWRARANACARADTPPGRISPRCTLAHARAHELRCAQIEHVTQKKPGCGVTRAAAPEAGVAWARQRGGYCTTGTDLSVR